MRTFEGPAGRCFIDTNVWLYAFIESSDVQKRTTAKAVVQSCDVVISTQVVNETCVNLLKKTSLQEVEIRRLVTAFYAKYAVAQVERGVLLTASELREKYSLSFWDSLVVSSAISSNAEILYSEDMQNGLVVENKLIIMNPFEQMDT